MSAYACSIFAHRTDATRFVYVCENDPIPIRLEPWAWRVIAHGVEPPERAKPWLKLNRYYQIHAFPDAPEADPANA